MIRYFGFCLPTVIIERWTRRSHMRAAMAAAFVTLGAFAPLNSEASSAVCALQVDGHLLMIEDVRGRWQLPGGYARDGESASMAAERELREETGILAKVDHELSRTAWGTVFACVAVAPIEVVGPHVSLLNASHLGLETRRAKLATWEDAASLKLRFPAQVQQVFSMLDAVPASAAQDVAGFGPRSRFRSMELDLVSFVQRLPLNSVATIANVFGEFWFYVVLMPVIWRVLGGAYMRATLMGLLAVTVAVQTAKAGLGIPRPFIFSPELSHSGAGGFAMPSGHTASATCFFILMSRWLADRLSLKFTMPLALLLGLSTGLARVHLGVHYVSDVLVGMVVGLLVAYAIHRLVKVGLFAHSSVERNAWLGICLTSAFLGASLWNSAFALPFGVALGCAATAHYVATKASYSSGIRLCCGLILILGPGAALAPALEPHALSLVVQSATLALAGWWIASGAVEYPATEAS